MKAVAIVSILFASAFTLNASAKSEVSRKPTSTEYALLIEKNRNNLIDLTADADRSLKFLNYAEGVVFEANLMRKHGVEAYVDVSPGFGTCRNPQFVDLTPQDLQGASFSWSIKKMCDAFRSADKFSKYEDRNRKTQLYISAAKDFLNTADQNIAEALRLAKAAYENAQKKQLAPWLE